MAKYDESYWRTLIAKTPAQPVMGMLSRIVENQSQVVTAKLVDSLAEQQVLESLLESSKPPVPASLQGRHYLLTTPWRYPPLGWGSRFGTRFEPSLFYGSLNIRALLAEAAYYRFVFLEGPTTPFDGRSVSQHTVFEARFNTQRGYDFTNPPFSRRRRVIAHKSDYGPTQALGSALREAGIEGVIYPSARASGKALNVALLQPVALRSKKPTSMRRALCESRFEQVSFKLGDDLWEFSREDFLVDGQLPVPAA